MLVVGICAMDVKGRSRPMQQILDRLLIASNNTYEIIIFGDHIILEEPIDTWPLCDVLIAFHSKGFPLAKAFEYVKLRNPFCINDVAMQYLLLDRRLVGRILDAIDVATPQRLYANRDPGPPLPPEIVELVSRDFNLDLTNPAIFRQDPVTMLDNDTLQIGNHQLTKPFVEKPADSEDHNIYIYYPGGGCRRLFRKIDNRCSEYVPHVVGVRTDKSYVYERFHEAAQSEDIKVYTVGLHYVYAESRRSPVIDGIVTRNAEGKELRRVCAISGEEQDIARRVCMAFGQTVCGFDLLRDVTPGDGSCSLVLDVNGWSFVKGSEQYYEQCSYILKDLFQRAASIRRPSINSPKLIIQDQWRLKSFVSVFRHGDRTPKQKIKIQLHDEEFFQLIPAEHQEGEEGLVIRERGKLALALNIIETVLPRYAVDTKERAKLEKIKQVLARKVKVLGIKVQIRKVVRYPPSLLFIIKWGGDFTHAGRHQTKEIGEALRKELMILNKDLINNVQFYCSIERRVLATANVFAKAFLGTAEVGPGIVKVWREGLDDSLVSKDDIMAVKRRIGKSLVNKTDNMEASRWLEGLKKCLRMHESILRENIVKVKQQVSKTRWCCADSLSLFMERWEQHFTKILKQDEEEEEEQVGDGKKEHDNNSWFDPSIISDFYDTLKFDALHHRDVLEALFTNDTAASQESLHQLYHHAQRLFDYVGPREYGDTDSNERVQIGRQISGLLLQQIVHDLFTATTNSSTSLRMYFTKESHITALLNLLHTSGLALNDQKSGGEMDYLSHVCFEVWEKPSLDGSAKHSIRVGLSNGAHASGLLDSRLSGTHALAVGPRRWITSFIDSTTAINLLSNKCQ